MSGFPQSLREKLVDSSVLSARLIKYRFLDEQLSAAGLSVFLGLAPLGHSFMNFIYEVILFIDLLLLYKCIYLYYFSFFFLSFFILRVGGGV